MKNYSYLLNPLEIELDEILRLKLLEKKLIIEKKSGILYHYTNLEGFKNIIENQSFYFSNSAYLNDKQEYKQGIKSFREGLKNIDIDDKELLSQIEILFDEIIKNDKSERYVVCFSLEGDLLSQWRAYANDGNGICLGFDLNSLRKEFKGIGSFLITYNESSQNEIASEVLSESFEFYNSKKTILLNIMNEIEYHKLISKEIFNQIDKYIGQLKHSAFEEEKEFRFEIRIDNDIANNRTIDYKVGKNNLFVPYINEKVNKLPLKKVIIGPSLSEELNKISISDFLTNLILNGENIYKNDFIDVNKSNIPYRN